MNFWETDLQERIYASREKLLKFRYEVMRKYIWLNLFHNA